MKQPPSFPQHHGSSEPKSPDHVDHYQDDGLKEVQREGRFDVWIALLLTAIFLISLGSFFFGETKPEPEVTNPIPWQSHPPVSRGREDLY